MADKEQEYSAFTIEIGLTSHREGWKVEDDSDAAVSENGHTDELVHLGLLAVSLPMMIRNILSAEHETEVLLYDFMERIHERERPNSIYFLDMTTDKSLALSLIKQIADRALADSRFNNQFWVVKVEPQIPPKFE